MATESDGGKLEGGENPSQGKKAKRCKSCWGARAVPCPAGRSPEPSHGPGVLTSHLQAKALALKCFTCVIDSVVLWKVRIFEEFSPSLLAVHAPGSGGDVRRRVWW